VYSIAICEDEKQFSQAEEKICTDILKCNSIEHSISVFDSSENFLSAFFGEQKRYDLIILDIVMEKMNGMELAEEIRKHDNKTTIIFITSSPEYALQGYDVRAMHYLLKPIDSQALEQLVLTDYHEKFQNFFLCFKSGTKTLRISADDIIRAETVGRQVIITLANSFVNYPGKLTELLEKLPNDRFVRCHKSFIINLCNTRELTRNSAVSVNGTETPVSRTFLYETKQAFLRQINV
jgi:DNA-binding LytR/AlgR family response regulator